MGKKKIQEESKAIINKNAWDLSNGDEFVNNYQKWLNSTPTFYQTNAPAVSKSKNKYLDANNNNSTPIDPTPISNATSAGDSISKYLALGAGGTVAGTVLGLGANMIQQNQQLNNQKELMKMQDEMNRKNVLQNASLQVHGMQNAGLNPASLAGGMPSAPTVSQGAAGMGSMSIENIFDGLANVIAAAKAPSEIDLIKAQKELTESQTSKTEAETENVGASTEKTKTETKLLIPANVKSLEASAEKAIADTKNAKNLAEIFESRTKGINEMGKTIFGTYKAQLEQDGSWNKLTEEQKQTINDIVDGKTVLDIGRLEALRDLISTKGQFSATDTEILNNSLTNKINAAKINDPKFIKATVEMPDTLKRKLEAEIRRYNQDIAESKAQVGLINMETNRSTIEARSKVVNDPNLMRDLGLKKELDNYYKTKGINDGAEVVKGAVQGGVTGLLFGRGNRKPGKKTSRTSTTLPDGKHSYSETTTDYGL